MQTSKDERMGLSPGAPQRRGRPLRAEPAYLRSRDPVMRVLQEQAEHVARSGETVLLLGETGVGKDVFAHLIHRASPRAGKPFVAINCAALPEGLLESELFGHVRGAFTGAIDTNSGRLESAAGGTVFLDEIGELPPRLQAKLLHLLQDRSFCRVGGREPLRVDVRFLAATNQDMEQAMAAGQFRRDLYYRLCVVQFRIPPLRERPTDIEDLSRFFAAKYSSQFNRPDMAHVDERMWKALQTHKLEGNVRELENLIKRGILLGGYEKALSEAWQPANAVKTESQSAISGDSDSKDFPLSPLKQVTRKAVEEAERRAIKSALSVTRWNRRGAARLLKVSYRSLLQKISDYSILPGAEDRSLRPAESVVGKARPPS